MDHYHQVVVMNNLLDKNLKDDFLSEIKEEYEQIRKEFYEGRLEKKLLSIEKARSQKFKIDWKIFINEC